MKNGLLDPTVDFVFKNIFGSPKHPNILISFLNATLKPQNPIISVELLNTDIEKQFHDDKLSRLDVSATTDKGEIVNIEIQVNNELDMIKRSLYYWSKLYEDQLKAGDSYLQLQRTICINILYFNCLETENFHTTYRLKETTTHEELTDVCEMHFIEIKKMNHESETFDLLEGWMRFLQDPSSTRVRELELEIEEIREAKDELVRLSNDKAERERYEVRQKQIKDFISAHETGVEKGIEQERERNKIKQLESAKAFLETGLSLEQISRIMNLTEDERTILMNL
ncbi:MAG: Rpn family recombination-promoting nuclease/putative transposase [Turicibacter sp.]